MERKSRLLRSMLQHTENENDKERTMDASRPMAKEGLTWLRINVKKHDFNKNVAFDNIKWEESSLLG